MEFVPNHAPAVTLGFLGTCLALGVAGLALIYSWATKRTGRALLALAAGVVVGGLYVTLLLAAAVASEEKTLAPGEWKYFCEVDCHLAYTVTAVRTTKTLGPARPARLPIFGGQARGPAENPRTAAGLYYVVTIKTWFDARTVSSRRPRDLKLTPDPRIVVVVDGYGNYYTPLDTTGTPLTQPLLPGESYTTDFVFDLPANRPNFRLLLTANGRVNWFLIGHESSLFHKKVFFSLDSPS